MKTIFQFQSIKNRLTFWFLVVALIPLIIVSAISYQQRVKAVQKRSFDKIAAIRDLKIKQINVWLNERFSDIQTFANDPEMKSLEYLFDGQPQTQRHMDIFQSIREYLSDNVVINMAYTEAYIIDPASGQIKISTNKLLEGANRSDNPYFTEPLKTGEIYVKDIFYSKTLDKISMTISSPIRCRSHKDQHIVGVLVLRVDLAHTIYDLLGDRSGLGETGETFIVDNDLTALCKLRGHTGAPLSLKINAEPARLASQGKTGIIKSIDYRGKTVLAAYGYIPTTQWGFVAKQDLDELNAPIRAMLVDFSLMMILSVIAVFWLSFLLSRGISRPVLEMTAVSKKIEAGDLSARNQTFHADEIGFLEQSFNNMADSLKSQMEVQQAGAGIAETMSAARDPKDFALKLLKALLEATHSSLGSFYVLNDSNTRFEHLASIGMSSESMVHFDANNFEGEFGNVLATRQISHIDEIPEDTVFKFKTFTGVVIPKEIISIPVVMDEKVAAVISIASIKKYLKKELDIINHAWVMGLGTAFSNLMANEKKKNLADQLAEKNEELESQARMLRAQTKELIQKSEELYEQNLELEIKRREVEEANRLKSQFLSNMSHELRTPLNSIMALSRVLIKHTKQKISEEDHSYLEIIERNGKDLLALISDILDLSKIEAGRVDINPKLMAPRSIVETIAESLAPVAEEKGIQINSEFPDKFPQIESDETRVHQILQNIIGNAVKFTDEGGVNISGRTDKENIYIAISDTGIGIPQEQLHHIFEEFRQIDGSSSRKYEGTGLGLAIAYKSTKMLCGDITVESILEKGSTFILTLPIKWRGEESLFEPTPRKSHVGIKPEKKTILVVDDDLESANLISSSLLQEGYNTIAATSGKEALKLVESYSPFAITLDILMPDMDGWEVLQTLKKNPETKDIPVLIVSMTKDRETGFALGAVGYVMKPINKELLISEIRRSARPDKVAAGKFTVMVVDDNVFDRNEMTQVIEAQGMNVITAEDGNQCLDLLREKSPNVLVLDLIMPRMDGFKVLDVVRSNPELKDLPVIVVTAKDLTDADMRRLKGGVFSVLEKTINTPKTLVDEILKILADLEKPSSEDKGNIVIGQESETESLPNENNPESYLDVFSPLGEEETIPLPIRPENTSEKNIEGEPVILIVEDNPDNMITIKAVLQDRFNLLKAADGKEGLNVIYTKKPDLVLLDMALPKVDGLTIVREIKNNDEFQHIPIIALTAQAMKGDKERIIGEGCDDYISKPFDPEELQDKIENILKKRLPKTK